MLKSLHRKDLHIPAIEATWLQVKFPSTSVLFAVMYRPPNDRNFFDVLDTLLEKAWLKSSNIFFWEISTVILVILVAQKIK